MAVSLPPPQRRKTRLFDAVSSCLDVSIPIPPLRSLITDYAEWTCEITPVRVIIEDTDTTNIAISDGAYHHWRQERGGNDYGGRYYSSQIRSRLDDRAVSIWGEFGNPMPDSFVKTLLSSRNAVYVIRRASVHCMLAASAGPRLIAGSPEDGYSAIVDGIGQAVRFGTISDAIFSHDGQSLLVADFKNDAVRRIDLSGDHRVTTVLNLSHRVLNLKHELPTPTTLVLDRSKLGMEKSAYYFTSFSDRGRLNLYRVSPGASSSPVVRRIKFRPLPGQTKRPNPITSNALTCTPKGTVIVADVLHNAIHAIHPATGDVETLGVLNRIPMPIQDGQLAIHCDSDGHRVCIWHRPIGMHLYSLPDDC